MASRIILCRQLCKPSTSCISPPSQENIKILRFQRTGAWPSQHHPSRRPIHTHTHTHTPQQKDIQLIGDDPALYDGKPRWWARWAWGLLALDMIFTASTIDITMKHWTERVEQKATSSSLSSASHPGQQNEDEYELRPLYQRLLLSALQLVGGAVVGGFIMASRDRTVWRIQLKRLPIVVAAKSKLSASRPLAKPHVHQHTHIPSQSAPAVVTLSTASGRSKRFHLRECLLSAGRDPTELILRVHGIRGHWWIGLNNSKILGASEKEIAGPRPTDDGGLAAIVEMRSRMMKAWDAAGGLVDFGPRREAASKSVGGWTSGPAAKT